MDLDLTVERGEIFGFLGPNGAGKTTTIRLLLDLLRPSSGRAAILGTEVQAGGARLRERIGYLPGDLALFPRQTGAELLDFFARLRRAPARFGEPVLERLGFPRVALARQCRTYSTGMRQMLGIAIAFQHEPDLLILDEPTTGLDPIVRAAFLDLLRDVRGRGATIFLSSHVLDEVDRVADRVGLIARSRLRLVETVVDLRRKWPRRVRLLMPGGAEREFEEGGDVLPLLDRIRALGPDDVEIVRAGLDEVFRSVVADCGNP